uniref:Protein DETOXIFICATION n=1 Tax=Chenopodium quinoa TaxID=63459 RepID=A0A803MCJ4_CHEQI
MDEQKIPFLKNYNHSDNEALQSSKQLLQHHPTPIYQGGNQEDDYVEHTTLVKRVWVESTKLWHVVGPSIIARISAYTMLVAGQAFAGHLGDLELAAVSIACNVIVGFDYGLMFPLQRFLQCQLKAGVVAWVSVVALVVQIFTSWLFVSVLKCGVIGIAMSQNLGWWVLVIGLFGYTALGGCPLTWAGFSIEAFSGLWEFVKLSSASGVMISLENWYYRILILITGNLKNAEIALDALTICLSINGWEMMIPFAFFAGTGVRVANELGARNGKGAKFATIVAVTTSLAIGLFFCLLVLIFHDKLAYIFSTSQPVVEEVKKLSILLATTILFNSVQPVLSGVAVGSGWQSIGAYINIGCYYLLGLPLGVFMGWKFELGIMGIWAGMIGGTAIQTLILAIITIRCDWEKEAQKASMHVKKWAEGI